jgi:hypothetical protein
MSGARGAADYAAMSDPARNRQFRRRWREPPVSERRVPVRNADRGALAPPRPILLRHARRRLPPVTARARMAMALYRAPLASGRRAVARAAP